MGLGLGNPTFSYLWALEKMAPPDEWEKSAALLQL